MAGSICTARKEFAKPATRSGDSQSSKTSTYGEMERVGSNCNDIKVRLAQLLKVTCSSEIGFLFLFRGESDCTKEP